MGVDIQRGIFMGRPLRIEYSGAWYHVTSRGNERKDVFKSRADREKFLSYLESASVRYGAVIPDKSQICAENSGGGRKAEETD